MCFALHQTLAGLELIVRGDDHVLSVRRMKSMRDLGQQSSHSALALLSGPLMANPRLYSVVGSAYLIELIKDLG